MGWTVIGLMVGLPLFWVLNLAVGCFDRSPARNLRRAILLRAILPPVAALLLIPPIAIPLLQAEERHWIARLDFDALSADHTMLIPRPEWEYADWINGEIGKALDGLQ